MFQHGSVAFKISFNYDRSFTMRLENIFVGKIQEVAIRQFLYRVILCQFLYLYCFFFERKGTLPLTVAIKLFEIRDL